MDLDGIKTINDAHGHLFGAYVIAEAGKVIGLAAHGRGIAARFGGDEFAAAFPGLGLHAVTALAEEIRAAIRAHTFQKDGVPLHPGISVGVASFPDHARDPLALFKKADGALYAAKSGGKDCVRVAR